MAYVVLSPRFNAHNKEERNPMSRKFQWGRTSRNMLATVALAGLVVGGFAPATRAAVITFNANGGGATPNTTGVTGFTYNTGNVLITNALTSPGVPAQTGLTAFYQSVLTTVNGSNTLNAGPNFGFGGSNNYQFTVVAGFSEQVTSTVLGAAPSGSGSPQQVTTTLGLGGGSTNFFEIFANPTNTNPSSTFANFVAGTGFGAQPGSTLVLAGTIASTGFVSQFNELGTGTTLGNFAPTTAKFDPNAGALPGGNGDTTFQNMQSVVGNGSTNLSVTVNVNLLNTAFFPVASQLPLFLNFQTTSSLPFGVQVPSVAFYNSTGPNTGTSVTANIGPGGTSQTGTNGVTGPDFMFQANASNSFAVPEPGSITMALTAMGLVSLVGGVKAARRRNKTSAV
jgi:hypothetical protein